MPSNVFGLCSVCRKEIAIGAKLIRCTVSTCNRKRFPLFFCSPACWDQHLPEARHRDPGYVEEVAKKA